MSLNHGRRGFFSDRKVHHTPAALSVSRCAWPSAREARRCRERAADVWPFPLGRANCGIGQHRASFESAGLDFSGKHRNTRRNRGFSQRAIRCGKYGIGTQCEVEIGSIVSRKIVTAGEGLQVNIGPQVLRFDVDRQILKKAQKLGNLLFGDPLALAERNENAVGDLKGPNLRDNGIICRKFLQDLPTIRRILGWIARKTPRNRYRSVEDECRD
jgi:hypothetical protein